MSLPPPNFHHLIRSSDDTGVLEHAWLDIPRRYCGYTVDDVARGLIVICREPNPSAELIDLTHRYITFLYRALREAGRFHNRLSYQRKWLGGIGSDDCHGRALWALGTTTRYGPTAMLRQVAIHMFEASISLAFFTEHQFGSSYSGGQNQSVAQ